LRPSLIISRASINASGDFVCAQITSKIFDEPAFFALQNPMLDTALPLTSGIRLHKMVCLNQKLIVHKVSSMKEEAFRQLIDRLLQSVLLPDISV
jgi:mRNA-degrading endonuclease toxin of MazEF toxin-antitoxin module